MRTRAQMIDELKITAGNERITRDRVDALEEWAGGFSQHMAGFMERNFWGRLGWLLFGR